MKFSDAREKSWSLSACTSALGRYLTLHKFKESGIVFSEAERFSNEVNAACQAFFQIFVMKLLDIAVVAVWIPRN